jgi:hypothetical protein
MSDEELAPVCPGCHVVATYLPDGNEFVEGPCWETVHKDNCPWMTDPDSEPYP